MKILSFFITGTGAKKANLICEFCGHKDKIYNYKDELYDVNEIICLGCNKSTEGENKCN